MIRPEKIFFFCLVIFSFACTRLAHHDGLPSLVKEDLNIVIEDDLPLEPLLKGISDQIDYLKKINTTHFNFGEEKVSRLDYIKSLEELLSRHQRGTSTEVFINDLKENFDFYSVYGDRFPSDILLTSYYEPLVKGSLQKNQVFSQPLYSYPDDLIEVDFKSFTEDGAVSGEIKRRFLIGKKSEKKNIRANYSLTPYYTRKEIDQENVLVAKNLELCYLDPVDAFFMQIQGSGTVEFESGERLRIGYAGSNGRAYHSIGKFLYSIIPSDQMTAKKIEDHLRTLGPKERQDILNLNPSYVFFRPIGTQPITTNNTEVVAGRTLATDPKYFPKGLLSYLYFQKPAFKKNPELSEQFDLKWQGRFVLDQDTGGAIKGVRRADLFWGSGDEAKKNAGVMRHEAKLYYLAPKAYLTKP